MLRALSEYHIGGIESNIHLFQAILRDPAFRTGALHTGYLDELLRKTVYSKSPPELARVAALAASKQIQPKGSAPAPYIASRWLTAGRAGVLR